MEPRNPIAARLRCLLLWPWHALLIGALPVLHFWQKNFRLAGLGDGVRLLALGAVLSLLLLVVLRLWLRDWGRAGLVAALLVAVAAKGQAMGMVPSLGLLALAAALLLLLVRWRPPVAPLTGALNAALLVLVALPVGLKLRQETGPEPPSPLPVAAQPMVAGPPARPGLPDVYFILVDGLGQPATVNELFRMPRGSLTDGLRRRGARILQAARANYPQTGLSLASTLNAAPVPRLLRIPELRSRDRRPLAALVADSRVERTFRQAGYRVVTYPSGYPLTRVGRSGEGRRPRIAPNFLELYVLNDGAVPLLLQLLGRGPADLQYALHRHRLDYILDHLPEARRGARPDEPVFVFAHLLAPHPPFVWGPGGAALASTGLFSFGDGNDWVAANPDETTPYGVFWKNQATHVMRRLEATVDAIVAASPQPPVIIIQGDHGPGSQLHWDHPQRTNLTERFGIFSAWVLPPGLAVPLREDMTAMATFPALFAALFGEPLPPLEEGMWFARMAYPYEYFEAAAGP
ncbi:MAG: hypothetical protein IH621_17455 [Krumholzibacteria bacterium]|nr:hypothetical protein [Candidatus Krumholzibacteria bacterium]